MRVSGFVFLAGLLAVAAADKEEVAVSTLCEEVDQSKCTIGVVRINPCRVNQPCVFKKGTNVSLTFDFTPNFSTANLKTGVYWPTVGGDVPFAAFGSDDACLRTTCPSVSGTQQFFTYNLEVGTKLPSGTFPIKWKVWNDDNKVEICCFQTVIVLKKSKSKSTNLS